MEGSSSLMMYISIIAAGIILAILLLYSIGSRSMEYQRSKIGMEILGAEIRGSFSLLEGIEGNASFCIPLKYCSKIAISPGSITIFGFSEEEKREDIPIFTTSFGGKLEIFFYNESEALVSIASQSFEAPCMLGGDLNYLCLKKVGDKIILS